MRTLSERAVDCMSVLRQSAAARQYSRAIRKTISQKQLDMNVVTIIMP